MALRAILDSVDELPDAIKAEYVQKDGSWILDVEEDFKDHPKVKALKVAFERTKKEKATLTSKLAEVEAKLAELPEDFNAETYAQQVDELETLRAKMEGKEGDDEAGVAQKRLYEQRITNLTTKHEADKAKLVTERDELLAQIDRLVADEGLTKALVKVGVEPKLMTGATALLRRSVKVRREEDGTWTGYFHTDMGETPIEEYVSNWAQSDDGAIYIAKAKGGDGKGGDGKNVLGDDNPWDSSNGKKPNLFKQQQLIAANPERAKSLAAAAGVKLTIPAVAA